MAVLTQDFREPLDPRLGPLLIGGGALVQRHDGLRLLAPPHGPRAYVDAQLSDYQHHRRRRDYPWRPPLRMTIRARLSHAVSEIGGTVGFGFWNAPFTLTGGGVLAAPRTVWFFGGSPPNDMVLVDGVPGHGWKAAALDTGRWPPWLVAPAAVPAIALTWVPGLGRPLMRLMRRVIGAGEALVPPDLDVTMWHDYSLVWRPAGASFAVDGATVLETSVSPRGPLGLVIWIDSQYAVLSEAGRFGFGLLGNSEPRWLDLARLEIVSETDFG